jgi:hypothetical protein
MQRDEVINGVLYPKDAAVFMNVCTYMPFTTS